MKDRVILFRGESYSDKNQKAALIPLSLISLASVIRPDFVPFILDGDVKTEGELFQEIQDNLDKIICVAISALTGPQIKSGLRFAKTIRQKNPDIPIIWGGWHVSSLPEESIKNPYVDAVVVGLGQVIFPVIIRRIKEGRSLNDLKGVLTKENHNQKSFHPSIISENYLSHCALPAFDLLDLEFYRLESISLLPFTEINGIKLTGFTFYPSSFGCPFACGFCCNKTVLHQKSAGYPIEAVVQQLKELKERGFNYISFTDSEFFHNLDRVESFCNEIILRDCSFVWHAQASVQSIIRLEKRGLIPKIRQAGCYSMSIGSESGSEKMLQYMNKKIHVSDIINCAKILQRHHISPAFNFLFGLPNEKHMDIMQSFHLAYVLKQINPDSSLPISFYTPFPGTPIFYDAIANGLHIPKTLEEWGHYKTEYSEMAIDLPWRDPSREKLIYDVLTFYLPIAIPGNMGRGTIRMFKNKIKTSRFKFFLNFISKIALYRMEKMFFRFRIEVVIFIIYKKILGKQTYIPGGKFKID